MKNRVSIGVSLGDPAGIGPEIIEEALSRLDSDVWVRLYGPRPLVLPLAERFSFVAPVITGEDLDGIEIGRYSSASGAASVAALESALADISLGCITSLVTGPICKSALVEAGLSFPGQTEWVAHAMGISRFAMMLMGPVLRVSLVTTHLALRDVADQLSVEAIVNTTSLTDQFLRRHLQIKSPTVGILGLNPHASDQGRFGQEEATLIAPAIETLQEEGLQIQGPLPADTAFYRAAQGDFDALVAMYHDQGLGPLKLLHFVEAINVTLGLPRLRCAPDHGPAYDLAGTKKADPSSMIAALQFAARSALLQQQEQNEKDSRHGKTHH